MRHADTRDFSPGMGESGRPIRVAYVAPTWAASVRAHRHAAGNREVEATEQPTLRDYEVSYTTRSHRTLRALALPALAGVRVGVEWERVDLEIAEEELSTACCNWPWSRPCSSRRSPCGSRRSASRA